MGGRAAQSVVRWGGLLSKLGKGLEGGVVFASFCSGTGGSGEKLSKWAEVPRAFL